MVSRGIGSFLRHDQCLSATSSLQPPNPAAIGGIDPKLGEKRKRTLCDKRSVFRENPITIGNGTIPVPEAFYKIVYDVTRRRK